MIIVLDSRRPSSLSVDVNLRLEAFLDNSKRLITQCCSLGRLQLVETPTGLIVPTSKLGKSVQVDVQENGYGDGFGWKFLTDATLTASRIRGHASEEIVILTTDLMLAGQDLEYEARFFSETRTASKDASGGGQQAHPAPRITMVFVEVVGSPCTSDASDPLTAWNELQRLRDGTRDEAGAYTLDLIENTSAMFDSHLRCWLRDSSFSLRQACSLRLPATETFSGVVVEVEISHYLLSRGRPFPNGAPAALHKGFSSMQVVQGVRLDTLDQGLCHGDPLLCVPSQLRGSPQHYQANRRLFMAVCAELNERDMGLLLALRHPSTSLEERWLLLPQAPSPRPSALCPSRAPREGQGVGSGGGGGSVVDRGLLVRLATKEDVLEDEPMATATDAAASESEVSVERAAASASLEMLGNGGYNPLHHSSGLFEWLALQQQQQQRRAGSSSSGGGGGGNNSKLAAPRTPRVANSRGSGSHPASASASVNRDHTTGRSGVVVSSRATACMPRRATIGGGARGDGPRPGERGGGPGGGERREKCQAQDKSQPRQPVAKTREVSLRYSEPTRHQPQRERGRSPARAVGGSGGGGGGGRGGVARSKATSAGSRSNKRGGAIQDGRGTAKAGGREREGGTRRGSGGGVDDDNVMMML
eukprot:g9992.t1